MKLAILKERLEGETRVAGSPETVKKLAALGLDVTVELGQAPTPPSPTSSMPMPVPPLRQTQQRR